MLTLFSLKLPCFCYVNDADVMLTCRNLHKESSEVPIKTRSTLASLSFKGQATKHTTVKWSIVRHPVLACTKDESRHPDNKGQAV